MSGSKLTLADLMARSLVALGYWAFRWPRVLHDDLSGRFPRPPEIDTREIPLAPFIQHDAAEPAPVAGAALARAAVRGGLQPGPGSLRSASEVGPVQGRAAGLRHWLELCTVLLEHGDGLDYSVGARFRVSEPEQELLRL